MKKDGTYDVIIQYARIPLGIITNRFLGWMNLSKAFIKLLISFTSD